MIPQPQYVVYYRVSTKRQGDSGLGLEAQKAYIQHYYRDKEIIAEFTDVRSGKDVARRVELRQALTLCKQRRAILVVAKIDRLSRNTEQALEIYRELDGRLESCDIPNLDKFTLTLFMAIADRERELISIRTTGALVQKVKRDGQWRKPSVAFQNGMATQLANQVVREKARQNRNSKRALTLISRLRTEGKTFKQIADYLNEAAFHAPKGGSFHPVQVKRLLERQA
ncbi:resolvase, N-terminal (plasmid) [Fibrisoma limi BUZ 3]|uniref:Resolvase, N-terminal n=1 Tax=Fibrisoma limi BUZ 3 TaxID=1185876 RepID=I2GU10_9BACT|nr:recombinase family protein [Fibrisoma limi]CCH57611.1 resolvase, N-terminal [Fibrisoma limi BUZ 3]